MAVMRAEVEAQEAPPAARPAEEAERPSPVPTPAAAQAKLRDQLIALIPAEALGLFVAAVGFFASDDVAWRWGALVLVGVATPVWVAINYREAAAAGTQRGIPGFEMVVGTIAFLAWSTTVPATPWLEIGDFDLRIGTGIVIVVSGILTLAVRGRAVWAKPVT